MMALAKSGYIDSGYAKIQEKDIERYLELISDVYADFNLIAPKILIDNLLDKETTKEGDKNTLYTFSKTPIV